MYQHGIKEVWLYNGYQIISETSSKNISRKKTKSTHKNESKIIRVLMPLFLASTIPFTNNLSANSNQVTIEDQVFKDSKGVITINQSAGDNNQQLSATVVSLNAGGPASGNINTDQKNNCCPLIESAPGVFQAHIKDNAFENAKGIISINQAAGQNNTQINGVSLIIGIEAEELSDINLRSINTPKNLDNLTNLGRSTAVTSIDGDALNQAGGIVQINQLAGSGNQTANTFSLQVSTGVKGLTL